MKCLATAIFLTIAITPIVGGQDLTASGGRRILNQASETERMMPHLQMREVYGRLPLSFEANVGQTDGQVNFLARGPEYTLFLTATEAVLALQRPVSAKPRDPDGRLGPSRGMERGERAARAIVRMTLLGASRDPVVEGVEALPGTVNYLRGRDSKAWQRNIRTYARVLYRNVYPGVDLVYYGNEGQLEYDFIVAPQASPATIVIALEGASLAVDATGDLVARIADGEIRLRKPATYQEFDGVRVPIRSDWVLTSAGQARFEIGDYDNTKRLVIDPVLSYSTYLGGRLDDGTADIAVDARGNAYVTGFTNSTNFPRTAGAFQTALGGTNDAFVTKLDPTGSGLVYSTYFGGEASDAGAAIAIDGAGNAYVAGTTQSADFPTTAGAFQTLGGGPLGTFANDGFVAKLDPTGSALVYSTYLGGSDTEGINGIAVDAAGHAYVTGSTLSANFPTTAGAFQTGPASGLPPPPVFQPSRYDAFVTKLNPTGSALDYSTYFGGTREEVSVHIAVDALGNAYVTGTTRSENLPTTPGAFQRSGGGLTESAYVAKFTPTGAALGYATYLDGSHHEFGAGIAVDAVGSAFVTGGTQSVDFPTTPGAVQPTIAGDADAFVTKLDPTGSTLVYSTYIGGSFQDWGDAIALDSSGSAYVTGSTRSTDFPTRPGAWQPTSGGGFFDTFVTKLDSTGSTFAYASYLGGSSADFPTGIAVDASARAYVTGFTSSGVFPTTAGAFQTTFGGDRDGFVARITDVVVTPPATAGKVTGGGSIRVSGGVGNFAVNVQRKTKRGRIVGSLQYINHVTRMTVRSASFTSLVIAGHVATIEGTCTRNGTPCTFVATATDRGEPGRNDTFVITVSSASPQGGTLRGGNIRIHK